MLTDNLEVNKNMSSKGSY